MKSWDRIESLLKESVKIVEEEYHKEKSESAMELHNKFVDVIMEENADPQVVLFALEVLKAETLSQCMRRLFSSEEGDSPP